MPPGAVAPDPIKVAQEKIEGLEDDDDVEPIDDIAEELKPDDILQIEDVSKFEFKTDDIAKSTDTTVILIIVSSKSMKSVLTAAPFVSLGQVSRVEKNPSGLKKKTKLVQFRCRISEKRLGRKKWRKNSLAWKKRKS